jgi:conjugal transfer pilus assembly protein TraK
MTRTLLCALGLGALMASVPLHAADDPGIELPPVPRALLLAANDAPATIRHVSAESSQEESSDAADAPGATLSLGPKTIRVAPGTTAIVEVAIDHLNRIVTPFSSPQVRTVSPATTQVDGSAVYVATASEDPVSLFITEAGDTATAISLTLAPRHIPPREVRLVLSGGLVRTAAPPVPKPRVPLAASDQPYVEHIAAAFRELAQNRVPARYGLHPAGRGERVACRQPGLSVTTAQVLDGGRLRILAARARNQGTLAIDLEERTCSAGSGTLVAAVAAWPRTRLAPGQETELYVAVRPREPDPESHDRPSLLGGRR